jgi:WD40 repeat protein
MLVGSSKGQIEIWGLRDGARTSSFHAHDHWVTSIGRTGDGNKWVTMSDFDAVKVWDRARVSSHRRKAVIRHTAGVTKLLVTSGGGMLPRERFPTSIVTDRGLRCDTPTLAPWS